MGGGHWGHLTFPPAPRFLGKMPSPNFQNEEKKGERKITPSWFLKFLYRMPTLGNVSLLSKIQNAGYCLNLRVSHSDWSDIRSVLISGTWSNNEFIIRPVQITFIRTDQYPLPGQYLTGYPVEYPILYLAGYTVSGLWYFLFCYPPLCWKFSLVCSFAVM